MLNDISAKCHIDDLHPFADTEYGDAFPEGMLQGIQLKNIQSGINIPGTIDMLAEKGGSNVTTSRKQKTVAGKNIGRIQGDKGFLGQ
ncbi:MAG: hypothetical protein SPI28_03620 [Acetatifactor sp.]|nr:hypothetical protein [Acetatifactor sp.]